MAVRIHTLLSKRHAGRRRLAALLVAVWAWPLAQGHAAAQVASYIVGPNDVLAINIFDQPQMSGKFVVQPDGTFTFPLLGTVQAGGLTAQAIQEALRVGLDGKYLKNPQVVVTIEQYRSQQIFVMGEVQRPTSLEFTGSMTLLEALARAGSTTPRAGVEAVVIRQSAGAAPIDPAAMKSGQYGAGGAEVIKVDLESLQGGALAENVTLRGGDTVFVPKAPTVFVSGQVRNVGEFVIRIGMTVRQVVTLAGGVTDRGSTRRIQVIRQVDGKETTTGVSLQDTVQPGDTIVVRERLF